MEKLLANARFEELVNEIVELYKDGEDYPLDGDETEMLAHLILLTIDVQEGNITEAEYEERLQTILA